MQWLPKTKIGKISFWMVISGFLVIVLLNVIGELAFCNDCPDGYLIEGHVCNPACYYSTPACLSPSIASTCNTNLVDTLMWRIIDITLGLLSMISIISGGVLSFIALFKKKDRALLLYVPLLIGVLGLLFLLGELLFPH
jgi:hypothetical protein